MDAEVEKGLLETTDSLPPANAGKNDGCYEYHDDLVMHDRYKYRVLLVINVLMIIVGQHAFLCGAWPHPCLISIIVGVHGLALVFTPYLPLTPNWMQDYRCQLWLAASHAHLYIVMMTVALPIMYDPESTWSFDQFWKRVYLIERVQPLPAPHSLLLCISSLGIFTVWYLLMRSVSTWIFEKPWLPPPGQWKDNMFVEAVKENLTPAIVMLFFWKPAVTP